MGTSNLPHFLEILAADPALQERVKALGTSEEGLKRVASLSAVCGTPVSLEELLAAKALTVAKAKAKSGELSEDELEDVCGGVILTWFDPEEENEPTKP